MMNSKIMMIFSLLTTALICTAIYFNYAEADHLMGKDAEGASEALNFSENWDFF